MTSPLRATDSSARPAQPDRDPDLTVTVFGTPQTKGSVKSFIPRRKDGSLVKKANGEPMVVKTDDTGADGKAWMGAVAEKLADAMKEAGMGIVRDGGVWIELTFFRPRNKGHFGSGRNAGVLKDSAPPFPAVRPDLDKLERAVLDAAKGILYNDDGQVVGMPSFKVFGDPARLELRVWRLPATVAEQRDQARPTLAALAG